MVDYGRPLEFGCTVSPDAADPPLEVARRVDRLGLDLIGVQDHPYQRHFLDVWTLLSVIAATTRRVRVFPDVACLPLRPPAVLAKAAASLDVLSGGRAELGLGAGHFWDAIEAYGGTRRSPGQALAALEDAIRVIRLLWSDQPSLRHDGEHYRLRGARPGPAPVHPLEIWLGVGGPRAVALAGRAADGWLPSLGPVPKDTLPELHDRLDEAAAAAGRQPSAIRRLLNIAGTIADSSERKWVDDLTDLALNCGIDTFIFTAQGEAQGDQLQRLAEKVAPAVREHIAYERGTKTG